MADSLIDRVAAIPALGQKYVMSRVALKSESSCQTAVNTLGGSHVLKRLQLRVVGMPSCPLCRQKISWRDRLDVDQELIGRHYREHHLQFASDYAKQVLPVTYFMLGFFANLFAIFILILLVVTLQELLVVELVSLLAIYAAILIARRRLILKHRTKAV